MDRALPSSRYVGRTSESVPILSTVMLWTPQRRGRTWKSALRFECSAGRGGLGSPPYESTFGNTWAELEVRRLSGLNCSAQDGRTWKSALRTGPAVRSPPTPVRQPASLQPASLPACQPPACQPAASRLPPAACSGTPVAYPLGRPQASPLGHKHVVRKRTDPNFRPENAHSRRSNDHDQRDSKVQRPYTAACVCRRRTARDCRVHHGRSISAGARDCRLYCRHSGSAHRHRHRDRQGIYGRHQVGLRPRSSLSRPPSRP